MRDIRLKWWDTVGIILGFEGDDDGGQDDDQNQDDQNQDDDDDDDDSDDDSQGTKEDVTNLKSALQKERAERQRLERENKTLNKAKKEKDDADLTEIDRLKKADEANTQKITKLAANLRTSAVEKAIRKAASNFKDPSDAVLALRGDSSIVVTQDDDDPEIVEVDEKTVKTAVAKLAKEKDHWLTTGTKSASKFGGTGDSKIDEKAALANRYPALKGRMSN